MSSIDKTITFTLDLEDHRSDLSFTKTYPCNTRVILDLLEEYSIKGTFFVVGSIADEEPGLIREISSRDHEIAFHSYRHTILDHEHPDTFKLKTADYKHKLEDLCGSSIIGYRAPVFSLTEKTLWVLDSLQELGFQYSSSVIPGKTVLHGYSGLPNNAFRWKNGIIEIPVPVFRIANLTLPFLGGFYFRYLPLLIIKKLIDNYHDRHLWFYCHPYDFAATEPYFKIQGTNHLISLLLWFNRKNSLNKLSALLQDSDVCFSGSTFSEQYQQGMFDQLPILNI